MLGITKNLLLIGSSFSCCPCKQAGNSFGICYRRSELVCGAVPADLLLPSPKRDLPPPLQNHHHHCCCHPPHCCCHPPHCCCHHHDHHIVVDAVAFQHISTSGVNMLRLQRSFINIKGRQDPRDFSDTLFKLGPYCYISDDYPMTIQYEYPMTITNFDLFFLMIIDLKRFVDRR